DDRLVADGDVLADHGGKAAELGVRAVVADVDDSAVLDVRARADAHEVDVAAHHHPRPQRDVVAEHHVPHNRGHRIHVHPLPERRHHITVWANVHLGALGNIFATDYTDDTDEKAELSFFLIRFDL